jgi:hypothetical protein
MARSSLNVAVQISNPYDALRTESNANADSKSIGKTAIFAAGDFTNGVFAQNFPFLASKP